MRVRDISVKLYRPITVRLLDHLSTGAVIRVQVKNERGEPLRARVDIQEVKTGAGERWHTRSQDGYWDFMMHQHGTYTLRISAEGYVAQTISVDTKKRKEITLVALK